MKNSNSPFDTRARKTCHRAMELRGLRQGPDSGSVGVFHPSGLPPGMPLGKCSFWLWVGLLLFCNCVTLVFGSFCWFALPVRVARCLLCWFALLVVCYVALLVVCCCIIDFLALLLVCYFFT